MRLAAHSRKSTISAKMATVAQPNGRAAVLPVIGFHLKTLAKGEGNKRDNQRSSQNPKQAVQGHIRLPSLFEMRLGVQDIGFVFVVPHQRQVQIRLAARFFIGSRH
jgi:hypothetical protein